MKMMKPFPFPNVSCAVFAKTFSKLTFQKLLKTSKLIFYPENEGIRHEVVLYENRLFA